MKRAKLERAFGERLQWIRKPGLRLQLVRIQYKWLYNKLCRFHEVFAAEVKQFDVDHHVQTNEVGK